MVPAIAADQWLAISSQNRWHGVVFAGHRNARVVPLVAAEDDRANYNQQWSVQRKGTLICQKLRTSTRCGAMREWFSGDGLGEPIEEGEWVFVESEGAYAAVRVVEGGFQWKDDIYTIVKPEGIVYKTRPGRTMVLNEEFSPVILEVTAKSDMQSFDAFKAKVKGCEISMSGPGKAS
jgi:hypothetical protein